MCKNNIIARGMLKRMFGSTWKCRIRPDRKKGFPLLFRQLEHDAYYTLFYEIFTFYPCACGA